MNRFRKLAIKRSTRKFVKSFLANIEDSLILKQWEHRGWGDSIYVGERGLYGHLSGLRGGRGICRFCDLRNGDVIVFDIAKYFAPEANGKKYEIGLFPMSRCKAIRRICSLHHTSAWALRTITR